MPSPQPAKQAAAKAYCAFNLVTFVVGAEIGNVINVALTFKDARGQALAAPVHAEIYLSDSANGSTLTPTVPTSALNVGTNGKILSAMVADKMLSIVTSAAGLFDLNIPQTAAPVAYYLVVKMPDGSLVVSGAITYA